MIWGAPLILVLLAVGMVFSVCLRWIQVRRLPMALRLLLHSEQGEGEVSRFGALATSLAAMIGTGNIVGVATAVGLGGAGALFWMLLAGILGMATGYAEGFLAVRFRMRTETGEVYGGPFAYIERGMGKRFFPLARIFALCGAAAAVFGIGTVTQMNGIVGAMQSLLGRTDAAVTVVAAVLMTLLTAWVLRGGVGRISNVSMILVPVMGGLFFVATVAVLILRYQEIPNAVREIVVGAFCPRAAAGGVSGSMLAAAIRMGVSRGVFSNEAGLGSAAIASAAAKANHPAEQGLVNMTGTFLDTVVLCTLTGLAIVVTGAHRILPQGGAALTALAYNMGLPFFGGLGGIVVNITLILFAFASTIGWYYYGETCARYLGKERAVHLYHALFLCLLFCGAFLNLETVWNLADCFNGLMAVPNLIALVALAPLVIRETKKYEKF
ncbi:MAG: sodium:alanine symporter family protein [Oscillospiraceae bacterium]|nr:sodium:alanine symporter family protein [Oscillospiraceae bacterium]